MKKKLCWLLTAAMVLTMFLPLTAAGVSAARLWGDVDGSGTVDSTDARLILQYYAKKIGSSELDLELADVDASGSVDSTDARLILQYYAKKIDGFTVGTEVIEAISPMAAEAGGSFAALEDIAAQPVNEVNGFGYFALTTELNEGLPFNVACCVSDNAITAVVPAGLDLSAIIPTFSFTGTEVYAGSTLVASGVTALDLTDSVTLTAKTDSGSHDVTVTVQPLDTGLPSMAVTLENYAGADSIDHDIYSKATFYLGGGDPTVCDYAAETPQLVTGTIKGRGNSSWLLDDKKSYTVKLDEKAKLLDLSNSRNWALVANFEDKSLLRNVIAEYFAEAAGIPYVMHHRPVDMWIDGQYWGTYNLAEKIEIEGERVDITDIEIPEGQEKSDQKADEVGYLLEFDAHVMEANAGGRNVTVLDQNQWESYGWTRYEYTYTSASSGNEKSGVVYYNPATDETFFQLAHCNGKWATIKKPSTKDLTDEMRHYIYSKVMYLDSALNNYQNNPEKALSLIDVDSFVSWVLVEDLMDNTDASFHSSVYMSVDAGGKFVMGPAWDFDRSAGNCEYWNNSAGSLSNTAWFKYILGTEAGRLAYKAAWQRFEENAGDWSAYLNEYADKLTPSATYNFERWQILDKQIYPNPASLSSTEFYQRYSTQVMFLDAWLQRRFSNLKLYVTMR